MYYPHIKETAQKMRKSGKSLGEISKKLNVAKSTLSFWCKDMILSESVIKNIKTKGKLKSVRGLLRYAESVRKERIERNILLRREGALVAGDLSNRDVLMVGFGLYWGEGYKYENSELGFTNSNPYLIIFYLKWLGLWGVDKDSLIFRLTVNNFFKKKEKSIKNFWMDFLGVKNGQFSKTTFIQTNLKKASLKNVEKYKGILRVKVRRGTALRNKILGAIEHISKV